jgi:PAS domain S-box-containing protein
MEDVELSSTMSETRQADRPVLRNAAGTARSARRRLVLGIASLLVGIWAVLVYASWQQFDFARDRASLTVATLTRLVESWVLASIGRVDDLASTIEVQFTAGADGAQLTAVLDRYQASNPQLFRAIELVARDGSRIAATRSASAAAATDRALGAPGAAFLAIGNTRVVGGELMVPVSRPVFDGAGRERGSLIVEMNPEHLGGYSADLGMPPDATILVFRADGTLLAAPSAMRGRVGQSLSGTPLWTRLSGAGGDTFRGPDLDGTFQLFGHRAVSATAPGHRIAGPVPLHVAVGLSDSFVYAEAERRTLVFGLLAAVLSSALVLAANAIGRELNRRLQIERALTVSASAVDAVSSGIVVVDADGDGRVVALNPAFEALIGAPRSAVIGQPWADIVGPQGGDWLQLDKAVREVQISRPASDAIWVEIRAAAIPDVDEGRHLIALIVTDVTQRRIAEQAMLRAKNQAEHANRAKSDFLANMSHELRTPLNAILGFSEIISKQLLGPVGTVAYREYANDIYTSGTHLLNIITDILDFAKIEATALKLEESEIQLGKLLNTCVRFMSTRASQADVNMALEVAPDFPPVWADDLRLKQVVLNLLSNAIKFSPAGEIVRVRADQTADGGVEIAIVDKGCGMSPTEVDIALQPFRQIESSMVKRTEGTGLGLPLAKRLIELHGGTLMIDTKPGAGTTARARLPASRTRASQGAARAVSQPR